MRTLGRAAPPAPLAGAAAFLLSTILPLDLPLAVRLAAAAAVMLLVAALQVAVARGPMRSVTRAAAIGAFLVWAPLAALSGARGAPEWFGPAVQLVTVLLVGAALTAGLCDRRLLGAQFRTLQGCLARRDRDIRAQADRIRLLSNFDQSSGLLNRRAFGRAIEQVLEESAARGKSFALLLVEAPSPRAPLSSEAAESLRRLAEALQQTVRASDLVARWDKRCFALLLRQCRDPQPVVQRLAVALRDVPRESAPDVLVAGVTVRAEGPWPDPEVLLTAAQSTLAAARRSNAPAHATIWPLEWGLPHRAAPEAENGRPN